MKPMYRMMGLVAGLLLLLGANAWAQQEGDILPEGGAYTFLEMVQEADNIVFAQITAVSGVTIEAGVSQALKGRVQDKILISGFREMRHRPIANPMEFFSVGQDAFFFLNSTMVGSLPFEPIRNSVIVKVERKKVRVSVLSPATEGNEVELDFELFRDYLFNLVARSNGQIIDAVFLGKLMERLEKEAADPNSRLAPTYLTMVTQLHPEYDNINVLFAMLESPNLNSRALALRTLTFTALRLPKPPESKAGAEKPAPPKAPPRGKPAPPEEPTPYEQIFNRVVGVLKTDESNLMKSLAATSLSYIHDFRAVSHLGDMIDSASMDNVEVAEVAPKALIEPAKKAILRAIVEFEGDESLDILERELRKDEVAIFRLILQIFQDYNDTNLNLLLLDLLQDRNFLPRQIAILEYFRSIKDGSTVDNLIQLFRSPQVGSEFIRKSIIEVFEDFSDRSTVPFLISDGLRDPDPVVRQATARALGKIGDPASVDVFKDIYFKEPNRLAREFYVEALSQVRSKSAYDTLLWLQETETDAHMLQQIEFALKKSKFLSIQRQ